MPAFHSSYFLLLGLDGLDISAGKLLRDPTYTYHVPICLRYTRSSIQTAKVNAVRVLFLSSTSSSLHTHHTSLVALCLNHLFLTSHLYNTEAHSYLYLEQNAYELLTLRHANENTTNRNSAASRRRGRPDKLARGRRRTVERSRTDEHAMAACDAVIQMNTKRRESEGVLDSFRYRLLLKERSCCNVVIVYK